jgi:hypothetical protein
MIGLRRRAFETLIPAGLGSPLLAERRDPVQPCRARGHALRAGLAAGRRHCRGRSGPARAFRLNSEGRRLVPQLLSASTWLSAQLPDS